MDNSNKKVDDLEKMMKQQARIIGELGRKIALLERENNRRKSELTQIAAAINGRQ